MGENSPVTLRATVTNFDNIKGPYSYFWEFGDGTFAAGQTADGTIEVAHTYPDDNPTGTPFDEYVTTLKVTDASGGIGTATTIVTVQNVVPVVTVQSVTSPINEDGVANLTGSFTDVGVLDTHTATVNWGDGTVEPLNIAQGAGSGTYAASHRYLDDNPTGTASDTYTVTVTVADDDTGMGTAQASVVVNNVAPTVVGLTATPSAINENDATTLSGIFADPGSLDTHTVDIDWGDGSAHTVLALGVGVLTVGASHQYLDDNPTGTSSDTYAVKVTVADDDTGMGTAQASVVVNNVAPTVNAGADQTVNWGGIVSLGPATFNDLGTLDTHTATVDWGDGTAPNIGVVGESPFGPPGSTAGANGTISASHAYTFIGSFTVTVRVTDDDGGTASDTMVVTVACTDPIDVAFDPTSPDAPYAGKADLVGCNAVNTGTMMTITLRAADSLVNLSGASDTGKIQYRIHLDVGTFAQVDGKNVMVNETPDGVADVMLKYHDGKTEGLPSLTVVVVGNEVRFHFDLANLGRGGGGYVLWSAETQLGAAGTPGVGMVDTMPDSGFIGYLLSPSP